MKESFIVLLKVNMSLLLFGLAYFTLLRRLTFYRLNRAFLLFSIISSSAYPFLALGDFFWLHPQIHQQVQSIVPSLDTPSSISWPWLYAVFLTGAITLFTRLLVQFYSLWRLHARSVSGYVAGFKVRILRDAISPFSFWRRIYINPGLHSEAELLTILEHENVHVKDWHTVDILLTEIAVIVCWFNPMIWMIRKAVKDNIEFITDETVLGMGIDRKAYQYSLLEVGKLKAATMMANNFNISDLRTRIQMMNVKRSASFDLGRYIILVPLLAAVMMAFNIPAITMQIAKASVRKLENVKSKRSAIPDVPSSAARSLRSRPLVKRTMKEIKPAVPGNDQAKLNSSQTFTVSPANNLTPLDAELADQIIASSKDGSELKKPDVQEITVVGYPSASNQSAKTKSENTNVEHVVIGKKMTQEQIDNSNKTKGEKLPR